ncbi:MAG: hypothetical protein M3320_05475, partial [Actinomycetota bacterium]|nr:hypothetical protein [Actinomycetota bacterium]
AVIAEGPAGRRVLHASAEPRSNFQLHVNEGRAVLHAFSIECPYTDDPDDPCGRYRGEYPRRFLTHAGRVDRSLAPVASPCESPNVRIAATALAGGCYGWTVREEDGTERRFPGHDAELAGDLIAQHEAHGGGIVMRRRATGEEVLKVPAPTESAMALAADGTLAYDLGERRIGWSSPSEPEVHAIDVPVRVDDVRLAGDRIAVRGDEGGVPTRFAVVDRGGAVLGTREADVTEAGWDFDGRRVAFVRRPCSRAQVVVWDVGDRSITDPASGCTPFAPTTASARLPRSGRLRIRLACPAAAPIGCGGFIGIDMRYVTRGGARRRAHPIYSSLVDLDPGQILTRGVFFGQSDLRRARRAHLRLTVTTARVPGERRYRIALRLPRRAAARTPR